MRISTFFYTLKQGIINIFRNKWFSLASVATISACLLLFGLFYAIVANFNNIVRTAEQGVSVTVFFEDNLSDAKIQEIGKLIEKRVEVSKVVYVSAEEAWESFRQDYFGDEYSDSFHAHRRGAVSTLGYWSGQEPLHPHARRSQDYRRTHLACGAANI